MGGVWDDSGSALARSGGECITEAQAQQRYDGAGGAIAMDFVQLSHDGGLAGFGELGASSTIRQEFSICCRTICAQEAHAPLIKAGVEDQTTQMTMRSSQACLRNVPLRL